MRIPLFVRGGLVSIVLALAACSTAESPQPSFAKRSYDRVAGWEADAHSKALETFAISCKKLQKMPADKTIGQGVLAAPASAWQPACIAASQTSPLEAKRFFERYFTPYLVGMGGDPEGLFTGYFEPMLQGSLSKQGMYQTPVYALPSDVKKGVEYYSRQAIDQGALQGRGLELAWVDNPVDLFFLHIQGSGKIRLDDGSVLRVGYAGKNNQAYVALGKVLIDQGYLEKADVNMFTIKDFLARHPEKAQALMWQNPSYVFFRPLTDEGGPIGGQGVPLTALRSLAVDHRIIPYGMPLFVNTTLPQTSLTPKQSFQQLMIAQDTGGAIRGAVRGDIFFGEGALAETLAGMMKGDGHYTALVPNTIAAQLR